MPQLVIQLLGPFIVTKDGQPVLFTYDKVRALLAFLAVETGHSVPARAAINRARLASLLWPDQPQTSAQDSLRQALSRLRSLIDDRNTLPPFLLIERETIQINPSSSIQIDLDSFRKALASSAGHRHRSLSMCPTCAVLLEKSAGLVRGDFLEDLYLPDSDLFENWATTWRERIKIQVLGMFNALAQFYDKRGESDRTLEYAARQIQIDPYHEPAHLQMIRALVLSGQRSQAVLHFNRLKRMLADDLGISPSAETLSLFAAVSQGDSNTVTHQMSVRNLPVPPAQLVGRTVELSELALWLSEPDRHLISIVGPGGVGKTRLVIETVRRESAMFLDGAVYVSVSKDSASRSLVETLAQSLSSSGRAVSPDWVNVNEYFREREILLVLDGFEHFFDERERISQLLGSVAGLVILVTSRECLNISGEWVFDLGGLDIPPPSMTNHLEAYSSVILFCQCANQMDRSFELTTTNQETIGEICRLVGGNPLAIRLAAGWTRSLPCQEIAREIHRSLDFLSTHSGPGENHTSVRAVFNQSWKLLNDEERKVLPRLTVFAGGFDHIAAEGVAGAKVEILARLVDKSLLRVAPEGRYDFHDLIYQFATEQLAKTGEDAELYNRHFKWYYTQAGQNEKMLNGDGKLNAFIWLIREEANLRTALTWAQSNDPEQARQLANWMHSDYHQYGVHVFGRQEHR